MAEIRMSELNLRATEEGRMITEAVVSRSSSSPREIELRRTDHRALCESLKDSSVEYCERFGQQIKRWPRFARDSGYIKLIALLWSGLTKPMTGWLAAAGSGNDDFQQMVSTVFFLFYLTTQLVLGCPDRWTRPVKRVLNICWICVGLSLIAACACAIEFSGFGEDIENFTLMFTIMSVVWWISVFIPVIIIEIADSSCYPENPLYSPASTQENQ